MVLRAEAGSDGGVKSPSRGPRGAVAGPSFGPLAREAALWAGTAAVFRPGHTLRVPPSPSCGDGEI